MKNKNKEKKLDVVNFLPNDELSTFSSILNVVENIFTFVLAPSSLVICLCVLYQGGLAIVAVAINILAWILSHVSQTKDDSFRRSYRVFRGLLLFTICLAWFRPEYNAWYWSGPVWPTQSVMLGNIKSDQVTLSVAAQGYIDFVVDYHMENENNLSISATANINDEGLGKINLENLNPSTRYYYSVRFIPSQTAGQKRLEGSFRTLPSLNDANATVRFASSSCAQRRLAWGKTLSGFGHVHRKNPSFFLFLGDIIYADVPRGIGYTGIGLGMNDDLYRGEYLTVRAERNAQKLFANAGTFFQFDDHEIFNDIGGRHVNEELFDTAIGNWERYIGSINPPPYSDGLGRYYHFQAGIGDFFMLDTKTFRNPSKGQIIGPNQILDLKQWLENSISDDSSRFKFVISPVTITLNRPEKHEGWNCCLEERSIVLKLLSGKNVNNVVFITGDTHKPGVYEVSPSIYEIGVSPIEAFGPKLWGKGPDKTLYEETGFTTAFAVYTLSPHQLKVEIFGGGYHVSLQIAIIILTFTLFYLLVHSFLRTNFEAIPFAYFSILLAFLIGLVLFADDLGDSTSFDTPRFVMEINRYNNSESKT